MGRAAPICETMNRYEHRNTVEDDSSQTMPAPMPGEVMPASLLAIVWQRRWVVSLVLVLCLAAAFIYLTQATPIFTSTSRLYVEQSGPKIITVQEGIMTQSKNYLYTQAELLKSTPTLSGVADRSDIVRLKTFADVDNPIGFLKKNIGATVGKKDDIISVSLDSPYPEEAAQIVNAIVDSYITYQARRKRNTAAEVLRILQKEKIKRDKELAEKLKAMTDFKLASSALAFESGTGNIIVERLARLSEALTAAQFETIDAQTAYEATKVMMGDPVKMKHLVQSQRAQGVFISTGSEGTRIGADLRQLSRQLVSLERTMGAGHLAVSTLKDKIVQLEKQLADLDLQFVQSQLAVIHQRYLAAKQKEERILRFFDQQRQEALVLNAQVVQYTMLQSDWEQTKRLCEILNDRIKEINVTEDVGALNISILEVARPGANPTRPRRTRIMSMALVLGLMLGVGLALLLDWTDHRLRSAEEISAILGVPVLGIVPSMQGKETDVARGQKVHLDSMSPAAEAYRTIRTAVYFGVPNGHAKTLLITSPAPGDGKTTLASNLGITMAQAGQRTLVLDADFRRPMQHRMFEIDDESGLSNVLSGQSSPDQVIRPGSVKGLDILPCGPVPPNPSEMLNSDAFADLISDLADKYDRILIDSPPVMPVADARILGAICHVTLMVLRAEKSTRKASEQARDGLLSVGARILGVVVNDVPRGKDRYGYYSGYGYGYYSGNDGKRRNSAEVPASEEKVPADSGNRNKA